MSERGWRAGDTASATVGQLAALLSATAPRLGRTRLIALDGRSGSGKTWLAGLLADRLGAPVIHMDDLYPGWDGLARSAGVLADWVVGPLAEGKPAHWRRFDWEVMGYAEWRATGPAAVVVLEGCGSIRAELSAAYAARVWLDAPTVVRRRRLEARADWAIYRPHARHWADMEDRIYQAEETRRHCDIVIENPGDVGGGDPRLTVHIQADDLNISDLTDISKSDTSEGPS